MPRDLRRQFSFVYWIGFKDGLATVLIIQALLFLLYKIIF